VLKWVYSLIWKHKIRDRYKKKIKKSPEALLMHPGLCLVPVEKGVVSGL
jgi:hypothetical protein